MLVIIENKNVGIKLINKVSETNKNIRLYNYCNNIKDAIIVLESAKVDFIILEINFENLFGIELIKYLINNDRKEYYNSIIILSNKKISNNSFAFEYIAKPVSLAKLFGCINNICNYKEKTNTYLELQNKISKELEILGYNLKLVGSKYLVETILEIYCKKDYLGNDLKNNIYALLAKRYNKSVNTIYGDIKQATKNMYSVCNKKVIMTYFDLDKYKKPKIQEIIFRVLNKIKPPL